MAWEIWTRLFVLTKPSSNPMRVVLMIVCFILSVCVFLHSLWLVQTRTKAEEGDDQSLNKTGESTSGRETSYLKQLKKLSQGQIFAN